MTLGWGDDSDMNRYLERIYEKKEKDRENSGNAAWIEKARPALIKIKKLCDENNPKNITKISKIISSLISKKCFLKIY